VNFYDRRRQWERRQLELAIAKHGGIGKAAKALGIDRTHCYLKCRKLGIEVAKLDSWADQIRRVVMRCRTHVEAANELGMSYAYLVRLCHRFDLPVGAPRVRRKHAA